MTPRKEAVDKVFLSLFGLVDQGNQTRVNKYIWTHKANIQMICQEVIYPNQTLRYREL